MESILIAAIKKDGEVYTGKRHGDIFKNYKPFGGLNNGIQGFITNKNRFVDRWEAAKIAYHSGQIKEQKKILFSEDIY